MLLFGVYPGEEMPPLAWLHFIASVYLKNEGVKQGHIAFC